MDEQEKEIEEILRTTKRSANNETITALCLFLRFIAVLRVGERYLPLLD